MLFWPPSGGFLVWGVKFMALVVKAALFCDGCGKRVDLDPAKALHMKFGPMALRGTPLEASHNLDYQRLGSCSFIS